MTTKKRRPHVALGARVFVGGLCASATIAITALIQASSPHRVATFYAPTDSTTNSVQVVLINLPQIGGNTAQPSTSAAHSTGTWTTPASTTTAGRSTPTVSGVTPATPPVTSPVTVPQATTAPTTTTTLPPPPCVTRVSTGACA